VFSGAVLLRFFTDTSFLRLPGGKQLWLGKPNLFALDNLAMQFLYFFQFERCCLTGNLPAPGSSGCQVPGEGGWWSPTKPSTPEDELRVKRTRRLPCSALLRVLAVGVRLLPWGWGGCRSRTPSCVTHNRYGKDGRALFSNMVYYKCKIHRKGIHSLM